MKTVLKILAYFLAAVFGIILLLLVFMQTSWFKDIAKIQIETIANEQLNGTLKIGQIEGTFLGSLQINDIYIQQNNTTIFFCNEISLDYYLLGILSKSVEINSAIIDSFSLQLNQITDSSWNITQLIKTTNEVDTSTSSFEWNIEVDEFRINNSEIRISVLDTASVIPEKVSSINLSATASILPQSKKLNINQFSFFTEKPDLTLKELLLETTLYEEKLEIPSLTINTSANKINASGKYFLDNSEESRIDLQTEPIDFSEVKKFLPSVNLNGNPVIKLNGTYKNPVANFELSIIEGVQKANLTAEINNLNSIPSYVSDLKINNINIGYWLNDSAMNTDINGELQIDGRGTSLENLNLVANLMLYNSELLDRKLESFTVDTRVRNNSAQTKLNLKSGFGTIVGDVNFTGLNDLGEFNIETKINKLNTAPLLLNDSLYSNLNFTVLGSGTITNADISLLVDTSSIINYSIDSIKSNLNIKDDVYTINQFTFANSALEMNLEGRISPEKSNDIRFNITTKDLASLPQLAEMDNVKFNGSINGEVNGEIDSLSAQINYNFKNIAFQTNTADEFNGEIDLLKVDNSISADINTFLDKINISETAINKVGLNANYSDNSITSNLEINLNEKDSASITSRVIIDSVVNIIIPQLSLTLSGSDWRNTSDSIKIAIDEDNYKMEHFNLVSENQSIKLDGIITPNKNNLTLKIDSLNIAQFLKLIDNEIKTSGILDAKLNIGGNIEAPDADGKIDIRNLIYQDNNIGNVDSKFNLNREKLNWDIELDNNGNKIISDGFIPLIINADSSQSIIPGDKPLNFNLKIDSLELGKYASLIKQVDEMEGLLKSDLKLYNTLNELKGSGFLRVKNASVENEILGITYEKININLEADNEKFYIREFEIINDEGKLIIDGFAGFDEGMLSGRINQLEIDLEAKEFKLAESQNLEAKIDGKLEIRDEGDEANIDGKISILRSKVYLPYFTDAASGNDYNQNKPLLIQELEKGKISRDTINLSLSRTNKDSLKQPEFIKNINGQFTLSIPRNTWITSPDMNIELSGEIDVIKNYESIKLFGPINTVRGQFAIYGKEFSIVEGKINFTGGKEFNPNLNIILEYMFRGADRTKKFLKLSVNGTAQKPELSFSLDGSGIDEGNAISYLLFGKSLDQLTQSQQNDVSNSETNLAKTLAGNFLAAQLSSTLGDALGLDVIEISGSESWQQASLTAGKYLTDDLYVSYERSFGSSETNEVNPRIVTLEYQLTKFLFFQLIEGNDKNAGFDAVMKFTW